VGAERQVHPVADVFHTIQSIAIRRAYELSRIKFLVPVNVTVIVFVTVTVSVSVTFNCKRKNAYTGKCKCIQ
jgi:hypothetical protein